MFFKYFLLYMYFTIFSYYMYITVHFFTETTKLLTQVYPFVECETDPSKYTNSFEEIIEKMIKW